MLFMYVIYVKGQAKIIIVMMVELTTPQDDEVTTLK